MKLKRFNELNEAIGRSTKKYEDEPSYFSRYNDDDSDTESNNQEEEDDKKPEDYVIDAIIALDKVNTILSNNDGIEELSYSERGLLTKLKLDLEVFFNNTTLT